MVGCVGLGVQGGCVGWGMYATSCRAGCVGILDDFPRLKRLQSH